MSTRTLVKLMALVVVAVFSSKAFAVPTQVVHINTPQCDPLFIPLDVHELGDVTEFPSDEALFATDLGQTSVAPCPLLNLPGLPEVVVDIRNLSGIAWSEVWYVADPETNITNFDGEANDIGFAPVREAFRIDRLVSDPLGMHHPLIFESMTPDGIWEIGESWQFIIQDYTNSLGLPANAISSIGVGDASKTPASGIIDSSGSIIAITQVIPEPSSIALLVLGGLGMSVMGRRRVSK